MSQLMDLPDLDASLTRLRDDERRLGADLVELDASPTLKLYTAGRSSTSGGSRGVQSAARVPSMVEVWARYEILRVAVDEVSMLRGTDKRVDEQTRTELERRLTMAWIDPFDDNPSPGTNGSVSFDALVVEVRAAYEALSAAVAAVGDVWSVVVPSLDSGRRELAALRDRASAVDCSDEPVLASFAGLLDDVEQALGDDPHSLTGTTSPMIALDAARTLAVDRIASLVAAFDSFAADRQAAASRMTELADQLNEVRASYVRVIDKIVDPVGVADVVAADVAAFRELRDQADTAIERNGPGLEHWRIRRQRFDGWLARAATLESRLTKAVGANVAPIARRSELRGLLSALEAKAATRRRIEEPAVIDALKDAQSSLGRTPCDLAYAASLLETLGRLLSAKDDE